METRQLRRSMSTSDDWIKCRSKKRPNQFYMFNKNTGETKWCSETKGDSTISSSPIDKRSPSLAPICTSVAIRTPAQDRLKRLQNNLKKESKEKGLAKPVYTIRRRSQEQDSTIKKGNMNSKPTVIGSRDNKKIFDQQLASVTTSETDKESLPSTSKGAMLTKIETETTFSISSTAHKTNASKKSYKSSPKRETKKRAASNSEKETTKPQKRTKKELSLQENDMKNLEKVINETTTTQSTSTAFSIGSGFVNKIKDICKRTLSSYQNAKKVLSQKPLEPCIKKKKFILPKKDSISRLNGAIKDEQSRKDIKHRADIKETNMFGKIFPGHSTPMAIAMKGTATPSNDQTTGDFEATALTASPSQIFGTPNNLLVPAYERGSANNRLNRLRQSLHQQAISNGGNPNIPTRSSSTCSSASASVLKNVTVVDRETEKEEPMDWMSIEDLKTEPIELSSTETSSATHSFQSQELENMGEYYGTVNENLLRYAVEQNMCSTTTAGKWLNNFFYFVLDTNVLLRHLTFIEDLSNMKLCDTDGTVLYLPYSVLQELDKLKQFAVGDRTKVLAVRAIKYLNTKFESKNKHVQAQSALGELEHLVEVTSPDDRIINCCLQTKQHIDNVVLLTEDINLRTKAICNNILVSTKSDLLAKHI